MAAVDLADLIEDLVYSMSPPGVDAFSNVSEDEWVSRLRDGFWNAFLYGLFSDYNEVDGVVTHRTDPTQTFPREYQQIVILFTGINSLNRQLAIANTGSRYKAGSVEYEVQQSASLLNAILANFEKQRDFIVDQIQNGNYFGGVFVMDAFHGRQQGYRDGTLTWVGN